MEIVISGLGDGLHSPLPHTDAPGPSTADGKPAGSHLEKDRSCQSLATLPGIKHCSVHLSLCSGWPPEETGPLLLSPERVSPLAQVVKVSAVNVIRSRLSPGDDSMSRDHTLVLTLTRRDVGFSRSKQKNRMLDVCHSMD